MRSLRGFAFVLAFAGVLGGVRAQDAKLAPASVPAAAPLVMPADCPVTPLAVPAIAAPAPAPATQGGLVAGASLYYLKPFFEGNTSYSTTSAVGSTSANVQTQSFNWNYNSSPAVWLGWELDNGLGLRGRMFRFDQSSQTSTTSLTPAGAATGFVDPSNALLRLPGAQFGAPGILNTSGFGTDQLAFGSRLKIETYDVEATYQASINDLSFVVSAGVRYLHASQGYTGTLANSFTDPASGLTGSEAQILNYGHSFTGAGSTLAFQGNYRFGNTGLSIYGNTRGSLLVGRTNENLNLTQTVRDPAGLAGGNQSISPYSTGSSDHAVPMLEAEAGLQYGMTVGACQPFFRAAMVNQTYFDLGNASSTRGSLGLFGAVFSLGVNY